MQDNIGIVIAMILIVSLIVIFPLYNLFERQDNMSYTLALKATTNFVDKVRRMGYIDEEMYTDFVSEIGVTGVSFDIVIEAHRRIFIEDINNKGQYFEQYKIDYSEDIFKIMTDGTKDEDTILPDDAYILNKEDEIYIRIKNISLTPAQVVLNAIIPTKHNSKITLDYGGVIINETWKKVDSTLYNVTN